MLQKDKDKDEDKDSSSSSSGSCSSNSKNDARDETKAVTSTAKHELVKL